MIFGSVGVSVVFCFVLFCFVLQLSCVRQTVIRYNKFQKSDILLQ